MSTLSLYFSDSQQPRLLETRFRHDPNEASDEIAAYGPPEWNSAAAAIGRLLLGTALTADMPVFEYVTALNQSELAGYRLEIFIGERQLSLQPLAASLSAAGTETSAQFVMN